MAEPFSAFLIFFKCLQGLDKCIRGVRVYFLKSPLFFRKLSANLKDLISVLLIFFYTAFVLFLADILNWMFLHLDLFLNKINGLWIIYCQHLAAATLLATSLLKLKISVLNLSKYDIMKQGHKMMVIYSKISFPYIPVTVMAVYEFQYSLFTKGLTSKSFHFNSPLKTKGYEFPRRLFSSSRESILIDSEFRGASLNMKTKFGRK